MQPTIPLLGSRLDRIQKVNAPCHNMLAAKLGAQAHGCSGRRGRRGPVKQTVAARWHVGILDNHLMFFGNRAGDNQEKNKPIHHSLQYDINLISPHGINFYSR